MSTTLKDHEEFMTFALSTFKSFLDIVNNHPHRKQNNLNLNVLLEVTNPKYNNEFDDIDCNYTDEGQSKYKRIISVTESSPIEIVPLEKYCDCKFALQLRSIPCDYVKEPQAKDEVEDCSEEESTQTYVQPILYIQKKMEEGMKSKIKQEQPSRREQVDLRIKEDQEFMKMYSQSAKNMHQKRKCKNDANDDGVNQLNLKRRKPQVSLNDKETGDQICRVEFQIQSCWEVKSDQISQAQGFDSNNVSVQQLIQALNLEIEDQNKHKENCSESAQLSQASSEGADFNSAINESNPETLINMEIIIEITDDTLYSEVSGGQIVEQEVVEQINTSSNNQVSQCDSKQHSIKRCGICNELFRRSDNRQYLKCQHQAHSDCIIEIMPGNSNEFSEDSTTDFIEHDLRYFCEDFSCLNCQDEYFKLS